MSFNIFNSYEQFGFKRKEQVQFFKHIYLLSRYLLNASSEHWAVSWHVEGGRGEEGGVFAVLTVAN